MSASESNSVYSVRYDHDEHIGFIEEQRMRVLEDDESNSAQNDFLYVLEHLDPTSTIIDENRGLEGDVDCDILQKCNFKAITTLLFSPSKITSIKNIPAGIKKFGCADNYLIDMPELPDSILEVDVQKNAIKNCGKLPAGLKELNISKNQIDTLENLPASLEVLICDYNKLHVLNLSGIENLRVLHCSGNPRLVIENLPDTLVDFQMDNDVATQIKHVQREESAESLDPESKANYSECLYTYFELKKGYEEQVIRLKREVFRGASSKKAAKMKIKDLKPKCIECARPVGTVFKNEGRTYIAKCGDHSKPCSLDIRIFAGEYGKITDMLEYYQRLIELIKQDIMVDKLNVLFHYISEKEGVRVFKDNLDFYTKENMHLSTLKKEYDNLYFSEERQDKINAKLKKIQDIQERVTELFSKGEDATVDAMTIYIQELIPEIENLQLIKYDTRELIAVDPLSKLYQTPWRVQNLEYTFGEYPRVIKFRVKGSH
jgi:hypothetical protein